MRKLMLHFFIINPVAGRINKESVVKHITSTCDSLNYNYSIKLTEYSGHAEKLAYDIAKNESDLRVYSIGGDGTLNEVANGILKSGNLNVSLIPVPCGSGNDFVRSIGFKRETKFEDIFKLALNCKTDLIDVCTVNDRYFLNISSMGFDADVVLNSFKFKKNKMLPKRLAYIFSVFSTFITMKEYVLKITVDDMYLGSKSMTLLAVANGKYYGGGIVPAPDADIRDNLMDVCLVEKVMKVKVPVFFPKYAKGKHGSLKEVSFIKCKNLRITCLNGEVPLNIDGEVSYANELIYNISDKKIKIGMLWGQD
jgi:YegS/Rv2252/BmrU family lipid kinase